MEYIVMVIEVLVVALIMFAASGVQAQDTEPVLACLGEVEAAWYEPLKDLEGESIWLGYDNGGWDVPNSEHYYVISLRGDGVKLWIVYYPDYPDYVYYLPFNNTTPYADNNGDHYGIHPCGAFRVPVNGDDD